MAEAGSFVVESFLYLPQERRDYFLKQFQTDGAQIEQISPHCFRIACGTPPQVQEVGLTLFHTHFDRVGRVIDGSGAANLTRLISAREATQGTNIVAVDPDVRDVFPNSGTVNEALRALAPLLREQRGKPGRTKRST